ncbi:COG0714 MoxR-like ATPases [uncultured Caudovirales phage]|uniref:COG0714 MoxR-like ATPases n=1 Tax=uncultured Caudovirales phage TaxID=2100421 RepID=A0A6J5Q2W4_9CAUD|nr:COG0714 MoxR-like ATPases [uncultured Caudovirales phage]
MTDFKKKVLSIEEITGLTPAEAAISKAVVRGLIPEPNLCDDYIHRDIGGFEDFSVLDVARSLKQNVLLLGPTGSAKSFFFRAYGAYHGLPVAIVSCNGASDPAQWFGSYRALPNDDGTNSFVWVDGIITAVLRAGGVIFFDEINFLRPDISAALHQVLREKELILLDKGNEVVKAHPDALIVAAANDGDGYSGTNDLNAALQNRFAQIIRWDYDPKVEAQLVSSQTLLNFSQQLRESIKQGSLETPVPTNALIEFESIACAFDTPWALNNFLNRFGPVERLVVEEHARLVGVADISYSDDGKADR